MAASSLVYGMRETLAAKQLSMSVFEMGRAAGGRAATRTTRERPALQINHGAPAFAAHTPSFATLCEKLTEAGALKSLPTPATLKVGGTLRPAVVVPKVFKEYTQYQII